MKTNAIGIKTHNLCVNIPIEENSVYDELAREFRGKGQLVRHLLLKGLEASYGAAAQHVKEHRRQYYGAALFSFFVVIMVHSWESHEEYARRGRSGRRVREERVEEWHMEEEQHV